MILNPFYDKLYYFSILQLHLLHQPLQQRPRALHRNEVDPCRRCDEANLLLSVFNAIRRHFAAHGIVNDDTSGCTIGCTIALNAQNHITTHARRIGINSHRSLFKKLGARNRLRLDIKTLDAVHAADLPSPFFETRTYVVPSAVGTNLLNLFIGAKQFPIIKPI